MDSGQARNGYRNHVIPDSDPVSRKNGFNPFPSLLMTPRFFGFEYHKGFYMAKPEKAILDTLYFRGSNPVEDELEMTEVDMKKLAGQSIKYTGTIRKKLESRMNIYS